MHLSSKFAERSLNLFSSFLSLFSPFIFFLVLLRVSDSSSIKFVEIALSICSVVFILADFGVTNYAHRLISDPKGEDAKKLAGFRFIQFGLMAALFLVLSFFASVFVSAWLSNLFVFISVLLLLSSLDASWVYVLKSRLWFIHSQPALRYSFALLFLIFGFSPVAALVFGFSLMVALNFYLLIHKNIGLKVPNLAFAYKIYKLNRSSVFSELVTSSYSRLDLIFAGVILQADEFVVYVTIRKFVLAMTIVATSSSRELYLCNQSDYNQSVGMLIVSCFSFGLLGCLSLLLFSQVILSSAMLVNYGIAISLFFLLLPIAAAKIVGQFGFLFRRKLFGHDLFITLLCFLFFLGFLILVNTLDFGLLGIIAARLSVDFLYVFMCLILYIFKKYKSV